MKSLSLAIGGVTISTILFVVLLPIILMAILGNYIYKKAFHK